MFGFGTKKTKSALDWIKEGEDFQNLKNFESAILCYNEAIKLEPINYDFWYKKGEAQLEIKNYLENIIKRKI